MAPKPRPTYSQPSTVIAHAPVALPRFTCETTCCGFGLLFIELVATGVLFTLVGVAQVHQPLYVTSGVISILSLSSGLLGMCRSTPAAMTSLMVSIAVAMSFTLLGGLCVIFVFDVDSAVASYLNKSLTPVSQSANRKLIRNTKIYLILAASTLLLAAVSHFLLGQHLYRLVGPRRGAIAFLQTFSLMVIPFSMFLIIGGQYIVDSGTLASAPYTGIIVFGCGVLLLAIALLSFIGGTFEYRRLLSICVLLSYIAATLFVGLSIAYSALKGKLQEYIAEHWEAVRIVLPPTFQARYDRDKFVELIQTNLQTVAFVGFVSGLFTFQNAGACVTLMHHATTIKRQIAHDRQSMRKMESLVTESSEASTSDPSMRMGESPQADPHVLQRHQWHEYFASSKRRQRIAMRIVVFLFVMGVALIFAVMCANVVFATKCHSIGKLVQDINSTLFDETEDPSAITSLKITNRFSRGETTITPSQNNSNAGFVRLQQYGNAERSKSEDGSYTQTRNGSALLVEAKPIDVTRFLWLDGSCQRSILTLDLPTDTSRYVTINSNASVNIRGDDGGPALPLQGVSITTDQANINASQLSVSVGGLVFASASGEVELSDSTVNASSAIGAATKGHVYSALGALAVTDVAFIDCDATFATGAGTMELSSIRGEATSGRSRVFASSVSGAIYADSVLANWVEIKTEDGDIYASNLRTDGNSAFMGRLEVTSVAGDITMQQIDPRGSVHVETSSGNIKLQLKTLAFAGLYYLRSDFGNVTIRTGFYGTDVLKPLPDSADGLELQGGVNCDPESASCLSFGDLHVRSRLGDIEVLLGCDTFQCV